MVKSATAPMKSISRLPPKGSFSASATPCQAAAPYVAAIAMWMTQTVLATHGAIFRPAFRFGRFCMNIPARGMKRNNAGMILPQS